MVDRKKVLYISYDCITEPLTASQVLPYIKGLSAKFDIFLMTFNKKKVEKETLREIAETYGIKGISALGYHKAPSLLATSFDILMGSIRAFFIAKKHGVDFIHARSYVACAMAFILKSIAGIPFIFDVRGLLADERVDSGDWRKGSFTYRLVKFLERKMLNAADRVVLLSHKGADIVKEILKEKDKVSVIPTCVDTALFNPLEKCKNSPAFGFIYIGSLGTWYMLPEMLEFFDAARRIIKNATFLILTQSDPGIVKRFVRDKGLEGCAIEVKRDEHERVPEYLRESDASVFFIRPTFSKKASCPTKFAESLSMGVPVITNSGVGDLDYLIRRHDVGYVIEAFRKEEYEKAARGILALLKERDLVKARCRDLSLKEFSAESGVRKYEEVYNSVT